MIERSQPPKEKSPSKIIGIPSYIISVLALIFLSMVISTIIEWIGMFFNYWNEPSYLHAKTIFLTELNWVLGDFLSKFRFLADLYNNLWSSLDDLLIHQTGLHLASVGEFSLKIFWLLLLAVLFTYLANWSKFKDDIIIYYFLNILAILPVLFVIALVIDLLFELHFLKDYILAMVYIIQLTIVRILTIIFALPAVILITFYVMAEGMYQRQIRKLSGGMESSFLYHHTKRWIKPLVSLPILLLLSSPIAIHPSVFILVEIITPGIFILLTIKYFKKYL